MSAYSQIATREQRHAERIERIELTEAAIDEDQRGRAAREAADEVLAEIRVRYNELRRLALIERSMRPQQAIAAEIQAAAKIRPRRLVDVEQLRRLVGEGKSDSEIADEMGHARNTITLARQRLGIVRSSTRGERLRARYAAHPRPSHREQIRELLESGVRAVEVARQLGVHKSLVSHTRKQLGLQPRRGKIAEATVSDTASEITEVAP